MPSKGSATTGKAPTRSHGSPAALPQRMLGKTGELVPMLGYGSAPGGMGLKDEDAVALCHLAIDLGVTYIDTAPGYERAQKQLGEVMRTRRDEVFLVTKTGAQDAEKALSILEQSLKDLQTNHVDLTLVHSLGGMDVDRVLAPTGSLAGLREAQRRGWTRYVGFTAHNFPSKAARLLREAEVDAIMVAMNLGDRHTYNFEDEVLPVAVERRVGVAAMKVYGGAEGMKYETPRLSAMGAHGRQDYKTAVRYALGLEGVAVAVIGVFTESELRQNIDWVRGFQPLSEREAEEALSTGRGLSAAWGPHFGPAR